jgi:hypothetical protein
MGVLSRKDLLERKSAEPVLVDLPGGGVVYVRKMDGIDREEFESACAQMLEGEGVQCIRGLLTVCCACDENGVRLFSEDDMPQVSRLDADVLSAIHKAASKLNGLNEQATDSPKNSETDPGGGLPIA